MDIFFYTFGCKVNQYETQNLKEKFLLLGNKITSDYHTAQLCVINTCTVTAQSDSKLRQLIHKIKGANPECIIALIGCFAQAFPQQAQLMSECDIILGTGRKGDLPALVKRYCETGERIISVQKREMGEPFEPMVNNGSYEKTRAYMKIQDGCDQYCSYCVIPFARGHICSKPLKDIRTEAMQLSQAGYGEIVLTGINLCCYGKDFKDGTRLIDAIETVCGCGDFRVRLGSIEPEMISGSDVMRMARLKGLCPHFHLSLQSGCSQTLKRMNRHYDTTQFSQLCQTLREHFPDCALTTDIMVGFPGETQEEFAQSAAFVRQIAFADAHIFPYSQRSGTLADKMDCQLDGKTKRIRAEKMADISTLSKAKYLKSCVGKALEVLFERESSSQWHQGHAENYVVVRVKRESPEISWRRQIKRVRITDSDGQFCFGETDSD